MLIDNFPLQKKCVFLAEGISHDSVASYHFIYELIKEAVQIRDKVVLFLEGDEVDFTQNLEAQLYNFHGGFNSQSFCNLLRKLNQLQQICGKLVLKFPDIMIWDMFPEYTVFDDDTMNKYQERKDSIIWDRIKKEIEEDNNNTLFICYFGISHSFNSIFYNQKTIFRLGRYFEDFFGNEMARILLCLSSKVVLVPEMGIADVLPEYEIEKIRISETEFLAVKMNTYIQDYPLWINNMDLQLKKHTNYPIFRSFCMAVGFLSEYNVCKIMFRFFKKLKKTKKLNRRLLLQYFSNQYLFKITKPDERFSNVIHLLRNAIMIDGIGDVLGYYLIELSLYYLTLDKNNHFFEDRIILPDDKVNSIKKYGIHCSKNDLLLLKSTRKYTKLSINDVKKIKTVVCNMSSFFVTNSPLLWKTDYPNFYRKNENENKSV